MSKSRDVAVFIWVSVMMMGCVQVGQPPVTAEPVPGEVAFELAGPGEAALIVPVRVNGRGPYRFVLDTGATVTCLDRTLASELDLPPAKGTIAIGGGLRGLGMMSLVSIASLSIGDAEAKDLLGCTIDLSAMQEAGLDVRGLVGLNFLKAYRVTLDFSRKTVRFDPPAVR